MRAVMRALTVLLVVTGWLGVVSGPSAGQPPGGDILDTTGTNDTSGGASSGDGGVESWVEGQLGDRAGRPGRDGGRSPYSHCEVYDVAAGQEVRDGVFSDGAQQDFAVSIEIIYDVPFVATESMQVTSCQYAETGEFVIAEFDPQVVINLLIDEAYDSVVLPLPTASSAPVGDGGAPMITQLPTWLWIDDGVWSPVSASAGPVFGFTVTATAVPVNVTFAGGGEVVDCGANTGSVFDFSLPEGAQSTSCSLTYTNASSVEAASLSSEMAWDVDWVCQPGCGSGPLPPLTMTDSVEVTVAEFQAILRS